MSLSGAHDRPTLLRALPLNTAFGVSWQRPGDDFTGAAVKLVLTNLSATPPADSRKVITDYTLSEADSKISIDKDPTWVGANLTAGTYEGILTVNGTHVWTFRFDALTPTGGAVTP